MPTSNGQVTSRDIRQSAIKQVHMTDASIGTAELVDQAVSIAKEASPVAFDSGLDSASNPTITTTNTKFVEVAITIPSWAGLATVISTYTVQVSASADKNLTIAAGIAEDAAEEPSGGNTISIVTGKIARNLDVDQETLSLAGSTIVVSGWAKVSTGTETSNQQRLEVVALFAR